MLYLLALRQVIALNWGTLTHHASSYTTSLNPTKPNLTFYHRVRVHMPAGDLRHEDNWQLYLTGTLHCHESHDLSRYARGQLATVPHRYIALSTLKHLYMWLAGRQLAIGPQLVQLPILSTLSSPMDLCSNRLLGLKDVLHEADCGVRPRVNPKVLKCCVHYISTREVALGSRSPF